MEGWVLWCWCLAVAVVTFVKSDCEDSLGVKCWVCHFNPSPDASCPKAQGKCYEPSLAVTDEFCSNLRNNKAMLNKLCSTYSNGYHLVCDRPAVKQVICKTDRCPAESEHQTGTGASCYSYSHHASGFLFMATAAYLLAFV